jgi:hypothetical protein
MLLEQSRGVINLSGDLRRLSQQTFRHRGVSVAILEMVYFRAIERTQKERFGEIVRARHDDFEKVMEI